MTRIIAHVTDAEAARIKRAASADSRSLSSYIRLAALRAAEATEHMRRWAKKHTGGTK